LKHCILILLILCGVSGKTASRISKPGPVFKIDFSKVVTVKGRRWPKKWKVIATLPGVPDTDFRVVRDAELKKNILRVSVNKSTGLFITDRTIVVDLNKQPIMRWRWRVKGLPKGGDVRKPNKDDQALAMYIGCNGWVDKKNVSYQWATDTPKGKTGKVSYAAGFVKCSWFVIRNKRDKLNHWYTEERNVAQDFKKAYGFLPKRFAVSVAGNGQHTGSSTVAEVDFIEFIPAPKPKQR
jgi:Protein of unknown function (DUF3047)